MSQISDEKNCTFPADLCQSTELDKLDEDWFSINWNYVTRSIFKLQQQITHAEEIFLWITNMLELYVLKQTRTVLRRREKSL